MLAAMHAVEEPALAKEGGVVDVEDDALRHHSERAAILLDERPPKAQQRPPVAKFRTWWSLLTPENPPTADETFAGEQFHAWSARSPAAAASPPRR